MAAKSAPQFYYSGTFFTAAAVAGGLGSSLRGKKKCSGETVRGRFQSPPVALFPTSRIGTSAVGNVQGGRWLWRAAPHRYRGGARLGICAFFFCLVACGDSDFFVAARLCGQPNDRVVTRSSSIVHVPVMFVRHGGRKSQSTVAARLWRFFFRIFLVFFCGFFFPFCLQCGRVSSPSRSRWMPPVAVSLILCFHNCFSLYRQQTSTMTIPTSTGKDLLFVFRFLFPSPCRPTAFDDGCRCQSPTARYRSRLISSHRPPSPPPLLSNDSHVAVPRAVQRSIPKGKLMSETEWRALGVQQSRDWIHYEQHAPEPYAGRTRGACVCVCVFGAVARF